MAAGGILLAMGNFCLGLGLIQAGMDILPAVLLSFGATWILAGSLLLVKKAT